MSLQHRLSFPSLLPHLLLLSGSEIPEPKSLPLAQGNHHMQDWERKGWDGGI